MNPEMSLASVLLAEVTAVREDFHAMGVAIAMGAAGLSIGLGEDEAEKQQRKNSSKAADLHIQPGEGPQSLDRLIFYGFFDIAKASKLYCLAGQVLVCT